MKYRLLRLLFPQNLRDIPHRRWWLNVLRSGHILSFCVLVGGIYFQQNPDQLSLWVILSVVTGCALFALDLYASLIAVLEIRGGLILLKIGLLMLIPALDYHQQVAILFLLILLSSVVSHSTRRLRHKNWIAAEFYRKYAPENFSVSPKQR